MGISETKEKSGGESAVRQTCSFPLQSQSLEKCQRSSPKRDIKVICRSYYIHCFNKSTTLCCVVLNEDQMQAQIIHLWGLKIQTLVLQVVSSFMRDRYKHTDLIYSAVWSTHKGGCGLNFWLEFVGWKSVSKISHFDFMLDPEPCQCLFPRACFDPCQC